MLGRSARCLSDGVLGIGCTATPWTFFRSLATFEWRYSLLINVSSEARFDLFERNTLLEQRATPSGEPGTVPLSIFRAPKRLKRAALRRLSDELVFGVQG